MCTFTWTYIVLLMSHMNLEWCMSVILILPIFTFISLSNCLLKYRLNASCNTDSLFLMWTICIECRSFICWGLWGLHGPALLCCLWLSPLLTHSVPCCVIMSRKEKREARKGKIGIHKSNKVCSRFRTATPTSSLNSVLEIC